MRTSEITENQHCGIVLQLVIIRLWFVGHSEFISKKIDVVFLWISSKYQFFRLFEQPHKKKCFWVVISLRVSRTVYNKQQIISHTARRSPLQTCWHTSAAAARCSVRFSGRYLLFAKPAIEPYFRMRASCYFQQTKRCRHATHFVQHPTHGPSTFVLVAFNTFDVANNEHNFGRVEEAR